MKTTTKFIVFLLSVLVFYTWFQIYDLKKGISLKTENWPVLYDYEYLYWIDWDTIKIRDKNWEPISLRLIWIDAPESNDFRYGHIECFWWESKAYLDTLIWDSKSVSIEFDITQWKKDKYWRLLGFIWKDWINLNKKMIGEWYWKKYTHIVEHKYQIDFTSAEVYAKQKGLWLWKEWVCK